MYHDLAIPHMSLPIHPASSTNCYVTSTESMFFCNVHRAVHSNSPHMATRQDATDVRTPGIRLAQTAFILFLTFLHLRPASDASD
jgi:hypothetical protein